ncbi:autophagy-related 18a isoform X2 [Dermatophagoides farinae]|uniref:autophagy-related 18a isoform X2 n=1 Tax=Dermatophagoides farinae TaxID=6954 RepID=UPI003F619FD0
MSFSHSSGDDDENRVFVNFNHESTSLAVGTRNRFRLYNIKDLDRLELLYEDDSDYTAIAERLFSSSLLAIVSLSSPRKLRVCHYKKRTEITSFSYTNTILAVKLNRLRLVVCLEDSIFIYNITDLKFIHSIRQTQRNPNGIIALASSSEQCYLAYPAKQDKGEVNIFDAHKLDNKLTIAAHDNPLVSLTFDTKGTKLATASDRGTVIRVFDTSNGDCIYEFRRGYARCVSIYSLSFSPDSQFLCASSNTETVHIFKLNEPQPQDDNLAVIFKSYVKKFCQTAGYFDSVADIMNQWRSFATVKLPLVSPGSRTICAITYSNQRSNVLIATTDGYLYVYDLNLNEGGDCTLIRQHRLIDDIACSDGQQSSTTATATTSTSSPSSS